MKNKKGFVLFGFTTIAVLVLALAVLGTLIWFGFKINDGLVAFWNFLTEWWWAIGLAISGLLFHKQITGIVNFILGKFGVKV